MAPFIFLLCTAKIGIAQAEGQMLMGIHLTGVVPHREDSAVPSHHMLTDVGLVRCSALQADMECRPNLTPFVILDHVTAEMHFVQTLQLSHDGYTRWSPVQCCVANQRHHITKRAMWLQLVVIASVQ